MKQLIFALFISVLTLGVNAQTTVKSPTTKVITKQSVDIACGECQFKMKGKDCELAVKIDGKFYFVDGKGIDDFGDAHGEHGFCNAIRKAEVTGEIVNNRFKAKEIKLLPAK
ncbi:glutaminyl-tRNA synthetase [Pedobacter sp. Leaf176]|nr:glutaminyl-tRNA synthetase [Pedobacter sp. Leaf176]